jgi:hypothetical protein
MRNTLALIGLVVVLVVAGGWYLGWYKLSSEPGTDGHRKVNVDVNTDKIIQDEKKVQQKVGDLIQTGGTSGSTPPPAPEPKKVEGQPTGLQQNQDGSWTITVPQPYKVIPQ